MRRIITLACLAFSLLSNTNASSNNDSILKVFCFPADKIPTIDGNTIDWDIVPESYTYTIEHMVEDEGKYVNPDKNTLDIRVKVGWVNGLNRLYFLYEAYDNFWTFSHSELKTDMFEVVVDGDRSGGPFIDRFYPFKDISQEEAYQLFHGRHAQNYHIYTPPYKGEWCWYWGPQQWLKNAPFSAAAYNFNFEEGESGKLILEFYITPFDYASPDGPQHSVESRLYENKLIGLCWAVIDYDNSNGDDKDGFWNLSKHHKMYGDANLLRTFRLMPLESNIQQQAQ